MFNPAPYLNTLRTTGRLIDAVRGAAVLLAYLAHLRAHAHAWPTIETLSRLTGLSARAVQSQRAALLAAGLLVRDGEKIFSGRAFPIFKLANLTDVDIKTPDKPGFSAQSRMKFMTSYPRSKRPPMGASSVIQKGIKADKKGLSNRTPPAPPAGLDAAVVAALSQFGITGRTLHQLATITPPLTAADVAEAMGRAGKARATRPTGWAVAWLKSPERSLWSSAAAKRKAATAAADATAAAKRRQLAAGRQSADQLERRAAELVAGLSEGKLAKLKTDYLKTIPLAAVREKIGSLPFDQLTAGRGFRAYIARIETP